MEKEEFYTQDGLAKTPDTDSNGSPLTTTLDGNSDIILDAGMAGDEVARIGGNLRLAKDGHVSGIVKKLSCIILTKGKDSSYTATFR